MSVQAEINEQLLIRFQALEVLMSVQAEINEQLLIRFQALEVLLQEQRKEIDKLKNNSICDIENCDNEAKHHLCNECMSEF